MKKIMFSDHYGLTAAVIAGQKTMTRRSIPKRLLVDAGVFSGGDRKKMIDYLVDHATYKVGDVVAVGQRYEQIVEEDIFDEYGELKQYSNTRGWKNKMYVKADLMPHRIRITGVRVEPFNEITDDDCRREGVVNVKWEQHLKQDLDDVSPQKIKVHDVWTLPAFIEELQDSWEDLSPYCFTAEDARTAFIVLYATLAHRQPLEMSQSAELVYVYEFKNVK